MTTAQPPENRELSASEMIDSWAESAALESEEPGTEGGGGGVGFFRHYKQDVLSKDGVELSFEEVRAKDFLNRRQKRLQRRGQADATPLLPAWDSSSTAEEFGPELGRRALLPADGEPRPWARGHPPPCLDSEAPLPDVREHHVVCLGGKRYQTSRHLLEESGVLAYEGSQGQCSVIIKLSQDFDTLPRLMEKWPSGPDSPLLRRFRFCDGCVTVYEAPPSSIFSVFSERVAREDWSAELALSLLWLMAAMRAGGAAPADVRLDVLVSCHAAQPGSDCLFPLEWCAADTREDEERVDSPDVSQAQHLLLNECNVAILESDGRQTGSHSGKMPARASSGCPSWGDAVRSLLKLDSWTSGQRELLADRCGQLARTVASDGRRCLGSF
ncbi:uncharacterized protein LOC144211191 isoform X2 [Stigmatopora nigra]